MYIIIAESCHNIYWRFHQMKVSNMPEDNINGELLGSLGFQVYESAKTLFTIKQLLYEMLKLNVSASVPTQKYDTAPTVVAGCKRNLDDLRRVESLLKGYLINLKAFKQDEQKSQPDFEAKNENGLANLLVDFDSKSSGSMLTIGSSPKNFVVERSGFSGADGFKKSDSDGFPQINSNIDEQIKEEKLRQYEADNMKLKNQVEKLKEQVKKYEKLDISEIHKKDATLHVMSKISQKGKLEREKKSKGLNRYRSAIFQTRNNLQQIRDRNKQCLHLIKAIKQQIGIEPAL